MRLCGKGRRTTTSAASLFFAGAFAAAVFAEDASGARPASADGEGQTAPAEVVAAAVAPAAGRAWTGITPENRVGGRMASAGYLRGKVVLFDRRDYSDPKEAEALRSLQAVWNAYKTKEFVLVGCHVGAASPQAVARAMKTVGITYPVYRNVGIEAGGEAMLPQSKIMVFDSTFTRMVYAGDNVNEARGIVGTAVFAARRPNNIRNWKALLDYELAHLPGRAWLRLRDLTEEDGGDVFARMKRSFPEAAKRYEAEWKKIRNDKERKELAELVEMSRSVCDRDVRDPKWRRFRPYHIDALVKKYAHLKNVKDPAAVQEAKNALADLAFAKAALAKARR